MPRPKSQKHIQFDPSVTFYKPQGVPLQKLRVVELSPEEMECLRLKCVEGLQQTQAAQKMKTSQSTFQRIFINAQYKVSMALIKGCAIRIQK